MAHNNRRLNNQENYDYELKKIMEQERRMMTSQVRFFSHDKIFIFLTIFSNK